MKINDVFRHDATHNTTCADLYLELVTKGCCKLKNEDSSSNKTHLVFQWRYVHYYKIKIKKCYRTLLQNLQISPK